MNKGQNKNTNVSKFIKTLLMKKLKKDYINVSEEELEEIINIYNHLLDFCLGSSRESKYNRFGFVSTPKFLYEREDLLFSQIFRLIIGMKKNNILKYLDYVLLLSNYNFEIHLLEKLSSFLDYIMNSYYLNDGSDDFIYSFIKDHEYILQDTTDNDLSYINESKYIPQEYKDIMNLYNEIIDKYYNESYNEIDYSYNFQDFINMTYYYFLINDLFNKEPTEIIDYLTKVKDNILYICDKLFIDGDMEYKERIKYIDTLYRERNKIKIIK